MLLRTSAWTISLVAGLFAPLLPAHDDPLFDAARRAPIVSPVIAGPAASGSTLFDSSGVTLMGWMTLDQFGSHTSGADCWGYTSPSGREYAIIGLSHGVGFVEVSDPGNPQLITTLPAVSSIWRDIKVYQDHAYYCSEGGDGIKVVDLSQIDAGLVSLVNTVTSPGTTETHNLAVDETSGFLYRTGGGGSVVGLRIYSLANPANPSPVGQWHNRYVHDAQVVTYTSGPYAGKQVAFCFSENGAGGGSAGVDILDVTNKSSITVLSRLTYSSPAFSHQGWLSPDRNHLYINDELDEYYYGTTTTTRVADVSNLSSPFQVSTFTSGSTSIDHNLYTSGSLIFEANYRSGLRVFDAVNPTAPVQSAFFDTYPENDAPDFNGLWSVYPYFPSGTVIGSDMERGLFVWRIGSSRLNFALPGGNPPLLNPDGDFVTVEITEEQPGDLLAGSARLHYDAGSGFTEVALTDLGNGTFRGDFPALPCGAPVLWYLSAHSTDGTTWTDPVAGPTYVYLATAAFTGTPLSSLDMETDPGWTVGAPGDTATTGIWTRVDPRGTAAQPEDDHTEAPGTKCFVTGQGPAGGGVGDNDVDGGATTLSTSTIDLSAGDATISYWRWYSNVAGGYPGADVFVIDISNDGGASWTNVETIGPTGPGTLGDWIFHQFTVGDFIAPTGQVRLRFVASDTGGGSIVEAAIDDFRVTRFDCDAFCQTDLGFGGPGASLHSICGAPLGPGRHATVLLENAPANAFALFFVGLNNNPTPFRGGLLVPVPAQVQVPLFTDGLGRVEFEVTGGSGGPFTIYSQFALADATQPQGAGLSNALSISVEP